MENRKINSPLIKNAYYFNGCEIYQLIGISEDSQILTIRELVDYNKKLFDDERTIKIDSFREYYDTNHPITDLDSYYNEALTLLEKGLDPIDDRDNSNELVSTRSKETLIAMKENLQAMNERRLELKKMIQFQLNEQKRKFDIIKSQLDKQRSILSKQVQRIERVITIIELYAGINEELVQLKDGPKAPIETHLSLRQQVLFMDEEIAIIEDQGLDWWEVDKFDEWIVKDDHYKKLLPEEKSIIVFKPRRYPKKEYNRYLDRWVEANDPRNHTPYFLIRNGESLYRVYSQNITVPERLFPKRKEFEELLSKNVAGWDSFINQQKVEDLSYYYNKIVYFLQGLIDRTDIFCFPEKFNLMKLETCSDYIDLIYDDETKLPTGRLSFSDWQKETSKLIKEGSRIVYISEQNWYNANYDRRRFLKLDNQGIEYPNTGLYQVIKVKEKTWNWENDENSPYGVRRKEQFIDHLAIKFLPKEGYFTWNGYQKRKNKISFLIYPDSDRNIINFDQMSLDDVEFFLNDRTNRRNYLETIPILLNLKRELIKEAESEKDFAKMMVGEVQKNIAKPTLFIEELVEDSIKWWKFKNKWKRAIQKDDALAYRMILKRILNKLK